MHASSETVPVFCRARMNYVARGAVDSRTEPVEVTIFDGRRAPLASWQECGFELMRHASALSTWDDDAAIDFQGGQTCERADLHRRSLGVR